MQIDKYYLNSRCISRIIDIKNNEMKDNMMCDLYDFIKFTENNKQINTDIARKLSFTLDKRVDEMIEILKIYKPFICPTLLSTIYKNEYFKIYNYILAKNLHVQ